MIKLISTIRLASLSSAAWISLTYHENIPTDRETILAHLKAWQESLRRRHPSMVYVKRIEWQRRGAIHWHLLVWVSPHDNTWNTFHDRMWIKDEWHRIAEPESEDHALHGAKVVVADSYRKILAYVSKDVAKIDKTENPDYRGRRWSNSYKLPTHPVAQFSTNDSAFKRLKRACRLLGRLSGASTAWLYQANRDFAEFTLLTSGDDIPRLLALAGLDLEGPPVPL